ncbi:glycosyltransferase family 2 protein [Leptospira wolffii]|uniref:glycosyltransferase family 2 protein n=1 Tax=Leptospira wolffii TaxID=409998 RepID=UPI001083B850|nr:glycosyltransferase family 2 protein [Leptospira wolffii]TGK62633.1 glycosyltransferase family 2 protein [Leptospira wolffii]TGK65608.1 glycosyltransferase family 2 protein [Leptospira wolffii]TGK73980.1 glycosyltransferase family 2 protein [Leptospira wolffii]TGL28841.1 glycosyltransferase family 2 protein [Leptospira wolffii]
MKLVINIPCYNEEKTLPTVLAEIPKKIPGIKTIEVQIVDDGSTDDTAKIAAKYGCKILVHKRNLGLGRAFKTGMEEALSSGADIFVNTDADNQYPSSCIPELIAPILADTSDIVIGNRVPWKVNYFSPLKKILQWFGNLIVRTLIGTDVPDTISGFRAYSRESLLRLNVTTKFSYVLDTMVQAIRMDLTVSSILIRTNPPTRESRLFKNMFQHIWKSGLSLIRLLVIHRPFHFFSFFSTLTFLPGVLIAFRFLIFYFDGEGKGHIQSLLFAVILIVLSGLFLISGVLAFLIGMNRKILEEILYREKKMEFGKKR